MTANEVYKYVCHLGFESETEDEDGYYVALNMAVEQINKIRPIQKLLRIDRIKEKPIMTRAELSKGSAGEYAAALTAEVGAASVYIEYIGICEVTITTDVGERVTLELESVDCYSSENIIFKSPAKEINISATGSHAFKVVNIAAFERLKAPGKGFEYGEYEEYDLNELTKERFDGLARIETASGEVVTPGEGIQVYRSRLRISRDDENKYTVFYRARPAEITRNNSEKDIEIDRESEFLIPLLTAYYVWLDADPQKAAQYRNEYEMQKAELLKIQTLKNNKVRTNGW